MKKSTKQGQRAPGKTQTSISLRKDLLDWARTKADSDGRSLSNWIEQLIRNQCGPNEPVAKPEKKR
jgi:hypothetical protein